MCIRDSLFTGKKQLVIDFCNLLINNNMSIKWSCDARIDDIDIELAAKMYQAGCVSYFVGLESGHDKSLKLIGNKPNKELVKQKLEMLNEIGMKVHGSFILGMPWEDEESTMETINYAVDLPLYSCEFSFATPFPYTRLYLSLIHISYYVET